MFGLRPPRVTNCHTDLQALHARRIAMPANQLEELRAKRDGVRAIIKRRLAQMEERQPLMFRGQGSYAMNTIIRGQDYADYDIDDGIYFARSALTGPFGGELSPLAARQRIWEAAYHERFTDPPEIHKNCVRVFYARGFHVDVPIYRVTGGAFGPSVFELASSRWKTSNPQAVTAWFKTANARSPGIGLNRQLTRTVRYVKAWARSRAAWQFRMLGGFGLTKLVVDCYAPFPDRDDRALLVVLAKMHARLAASTLIPHPVLAGEFICGAERDAPVRFLRSCLDDALTRTRPLTEGCARPAGLAAWGSMFNTNFFASRPAVRWV